MPRIIDVVEAPNQGANELVARIRAQLRHDRQQHGSMLQAGDLTLDLKGRRALRGDRAVDLTSREFALLEFFLRHRRFGWAWPGWP